MRNHAFLDNIGRSSLLAATRVWLRVTGGRISAALLAGSALAGCAVTSPHWDYVPESTTSAIPFQAWTPYNNQPVVVECANSTEAHGNPTNGEASYIFVTNLNIASVASLDSDGSAMYSASKFVTLPSACWKYFSDYDFWQATLRVSQVVPSISGGTQKRIFSSFDLTGLSCLGRYNGASASWSGFLNHGCEKIYLNSPDQIPYIVLRINGFAAGTAAARAALSGPSKAIKAAPNAATQTPSAAKLLAIQPITPAELDVMKSKR